MKTSREITAEKIIDDQMRISYIVFIAHKLMLLVNQSNLSFTEIKAMLQTLVHMLDVIENSKAQMDDEEIIEDSQKYLRNLLRQKLEN